MNIIQMQYNTNTPPPQSIHINASKTSIQSELEPAVVGVDHAFVHEVDVPLDESGSLTDLREVRTRQEVEVGLEARLLVSDQDVRRQTGEDLGPDHHVLLREGLDFGKQHEEDLLTGGLGRHEGEVLEYLGHDVVQLLDQQVLELEVEGLILGLPRELLPLASHLAIVVVHELLPPVDHEDGFEEGVGGAGDARSVGPDEGGGAELDEVGQLPAVEQDGGVVDEETLADTDEVVQQVGVLLHLLHLVHVHEGDLAEFHKHCPEVVRVLLVLVEDSNGDLQQVRVGTDRVARVRLQHCRVERLDELREAELQVPHDDLDQLDHALHLRVLVVLHPLGAAHRLQDEGEGDAREPANEGDVGRLIGDHFEQDLHDAGEGVHEFLGEVAVFAGLLQPREEVGEDGGQVLERGLLVPAEQLRDSLDDVLPVRVLLDQLHHVLSVLAHDLVVVLAPLREGALGVRHQQLVVEAGRGEVEEQLDEPHVLLLDAHQRLEQRQEGLTQDDRSAEVGLTRQLHVYRYDVRHLSSEPLHLLDGVHQREKVDLQVGPQELVGLLRNSLDLAVHHLQVRRLTVELRNLLENTVAVVAAGADVVGTAVELVQLGLGAGVQVQDHLQRVVALLADRQVHLLDECGQLRAQRAECLLQGGLGDELFPELDEAVVDLHDLVLRVLGEGAQEDVDAFVEVAHEGGHGLTAELDDEPQVVLGLGELGLLDEVVDH